MFGKKEQKQKTEKEIREEELAYEKRQVELLVELRTKAELKIEKSAIVTLSQVSDLVRNQTLINKSLLTDIKNKDIKFAEYNSDISALLKKPFDNVDSLKAHLKVIIDKHKTNQ